MTRRYLVRIPGYRMLVTATSVWDAILQVLAAFPVPRCLSARPAP